MDDESKKFSINTENPLPNIAISDKTKEMMKILKSSFLDIAQTIHQNGSNDTQFKYVSYAPALLMAQLLYNLDLTTGTPKREDEKEGATKFYSRKDDDANEFRRQIVNTLGRRLFPLSHSSTSTNMSDVSQVQLVQPILKTLTADELDTHITGQCKLIFAEQNGSNKITEDFPLTAMQILAALIPLTLSTSSENSTNKNRTNFYWDAHLMNTKYCLLQLVIDKGLIGDPSVTNERLSKATSLVLIAWIRSCSGLKTEIILEKLMQSFYQIHGDHDNCYNSLTGLCLALDQIAQYFLEKNMEQVK